MTRSNFTIVCAFNLLFFFSQTQSVCQDIGFEFGKTTMAELNMTVYSRDTTASAVVLQEFGHAYVDPEELNLRFDYHVRIKILRESGLKFGDVELYLHRQSGKEETINSFQASSFNLEDGRIVESKMQEKTRYGVEHNEYTLSQGFAIPSVKVGSVIEYKYHKESPWLQNFQPWIFQDEIPKMQSEYWATIPGYYRYNVTLTGYLPLTLNDSEIMRDAFHSTGVGSADCARLRYGMKDIPAFVEEQFMTARSNYIARLNFELLEVHYPNGRIDKVTTTWSAADNELKAEPKFGGQIRRGKNALDQEIGSVIAGVDDPLARAKKVYDLMKQRYEWNGVYGKYSENGVRKAFEAGKGNIGDINLSLVAGLRAAGLEADPVILSTRENGLPIEIHPVITDFNYVIAAVKLDGKQYLLDATDDFLPFGLIPERCINGKGRILGEDRSEWLPLDAPASRKWTTTVNAKILPDGKMSGTIATTYFGYAAVDERKKWYGARDREEYVSKKIASIKAIAVSDMQHENLEEHDKPLGIKYDFVSERVDNSAQTYWLLNPFFVSPWTSNPFKSAQRFYPVDFGVPIDERMIVVLEFPEEYLVKSVPENSALALPNNGGRYLFQARAEGSKATFTSNFILTRANYSPEEYHSLRELFARMIQTQATDIVVERR